MAKNNKPASEYAVPHTMSGGPYIPKKMRDPNLLKATDLGPREAVPRVVQEIQVRMMLRLLVLKCVDMVPQLRGLCLEAQWARS